MESCDSHILTGLLRLQICKKTFKKINVPFMKIIDKIPIAFQGTTIDFPPP